MSATYKHPNVGDRFNEPDAAHLLEWTGDLWAPVCPTDDIPMVARDGAGWLICGTCGVRATEVGR